MNAEPYTSQTSWKLPDKPTSNMDYSTLWRSGAEAGSFYSQLNFQFWVTPPENGLQWLRAAVKTERLKATDSGTSDGIYRVIISELRTIGAESGVAPRHPPVLAPP
jgi:hypothetical protein